MVCVKGFNISIVQAPLGGGGESEKLKKGSGSMVQGQVIVKEGGLAFSQFNFFKVYHFYILKLLYSLQNCVIHLKKNIFSAKIIL